MTLTGLFVQGEDGEELGADAGEPEEKDDEDEEGGNLLVRTHFIIVMIRWTGLAPWESEFPFPGSLTSTFLAG